MSKQAYSKAKGGQFELKVLRDLRQILDTAYRSIGSGNAGDESGDILTRCFCIECKFHKTLSDGQINKFWDKIVEEATEQDKEPILIYKENRREPRVMFFDVYRNTQRIIMLYDEWLDYLREKYGET
jgi:Holliday junction resolvase